MPLMLIGGSAWAEFKAARGGGDEDDEDATEFEVEPQFAPMDGAIARARQMGRITLGVVGHAITRALAVPARAVDALLPADEADARGRIAARRQRKAVAEREAREAEAFAAEQRRAAASARVIAERCRHTGAWFPGEW